MEKREQPTPSGKATDMFSETGGIQHLVDPSHLSNGYIRT